MRICRNIYEKIVEKKEEKLYPYSEISEARLETADCEQDDGDTQHEVHRMSFKSR